ARAGGERVRDHDRARRLVARPGAPRVRLGLYPARRPRARPGPGRGQRAVALGPVRAGAGTDPDRPGGPLMAGAGIRADAAPAPVGRYPHARRAGGLLFLSGIGPREPGTDAVPGNVHDAQGGLVSHDIAAQTRAVFANVRAVLQA